MKATQTTCDVCGVEKKTTNHWLYAYVYGTDGFCITKTLIVVPSKDICGQECATKLLQFWMATNSIDSPATRESVLA